MSITLEQIRKLLKEHGQEHLLKYYDELDDAGKERLLTQIAGLDFSVVELGKSGKGEAARGKITPLSAMELSEIEARKEEFRKIGLEAIRNTKAGAVMLAGGMGTRLGSDNPKGMYDIGLTKHVYIFERLIDNLMDVVKEAGCPVPLFIMTSDKNDAATRAFFKEHECFGYDPSYIHFFIQELAPATDYDGKIYLEQKDKVSTSPNGNGGWYSSMARCGILDTVKDYGIEWLNTFAVDNVLQRIADPVFLGATIDAHVAVGAKVVRKAAPDEKVGVICLEDGKPSIVEYYDLTEELMNTKDEKGEPAYNFGVILNYLFRVSELEEIRSRKMPLHVVEKKIPCLDENGNPVKPEAPNGFKYETLVLDMIHLASSCLPFEVVREKEFAPIKNKTGVDSVESARKLCQDLGIEL